MRKTHKSLNENGLTLIEVLASIVILTLIITAFLMMFLQSAKTNKMSEEIIDATYHAQVEMENIYAISKEISLGDKDIAMNQLGFDKVSSLVYTKNINGKYYEVNFTSESNNLIRVLIYIYNNENEKKLESQMETLLSWEEGH